MPSSTHWKRANIACCVLALYQLVNCVLPQPSVVRKQACCTNNRWMMSETFGPETPNGTVCCDHYNVDIDVCHHDSNERYLYQVINVLNWCIFGVLVIGVIIPYAAVFKVDEHGTFINTASMAWLAMVAPYPCLAAVGACSYVMIHGTELVCKDAETPESPDRITVTRTMMMYMPMTFCLYVAIMTLFYLPAGIAIIYGVLKMLFKWARCFFGPYCPTAEEPEIAEDPASVPDNGEWVPNTLANLAQRTADRPARPLQTPRPPPPYPLPSHPPPPYKPASVTI